MSLFIINIDIAGPGVGPSLCMNFFSLPSSCTNFFSWHFPLHEFFFGFFPTPPITFLMIRPLLKMTSNLSVVCLYFHPVFSFHTQVEIVTLAACTFYGPIFTTVSYKRQPFSEFWEMALSFKNSKSY